MIDLGALFGWLAGPVNMFTDAGGIKWVVGAGALVGGYTLWSQAQDRKLRPPRRDGRGL